MTIKDITPELVSTLKGQALRDCYQRIFDRETQSKDSTGLRKQILEELAKRHAAEKAEEPAPAAAEPAKPQSLAAQAKDAEEQGNWKAAVRLWTEAAAQQTSDKVKAKFAGRAAAAKVRADAQSTFKHPAAPESIVSTPEEMKAEAEAEQKAAKKAKPEKAPKPEKATEEQLRAWLAEGQLWTDAEAATFRHLMPAHLKYGKAKDHKYVPSIADDNSIIWTRTDKPVKAPKAEKQVAEPGERVTSSADEMLAALTDGQVLTHKFKDGRPDCVATVHRAEDGSLSFTKDGSDEVFDSLYKLANSNGDKFKVDGYLFFGLRKWTSDKKAAPRVKAEKAPKDTLKGLLAAARGYLVVLPPGDPDVASLLQRIDAALAPKPTADETPAETAPAGGEEQPSA